ncbi:OmpA family protein [Flagellimonas sp. DF-77]|uniref:OmpA family protein n=1 Tax=Flagellimonas algarum TaxID=3230298 RepID=UPI003392B3B4
MGTQRILRTAGAVAILFVFANVNGQNVFKRVKKKVEDKAVDIVDNELNGNKKEGENQKKEGDGDTMTLGKAQANKIDRNFIDRSNLIFYDDFDKERVGEFPKKWKQISGTVACAGFSVNNSNEGVVQMVSNKSAIKPNFDTDDYLGDSFKIELEHFFWQKGNEAYIIELYGSASPRPAYSIYLRSTNVAPGSDNVVYMAGKQSPGWYTSQISFNQGNLKVIVNGQQLVNNPDIKIRELTHLALRTLSPGSSSGDGYTKARVNHFMISKGGLPLYDRIVMSGRVVVRDIYFDTDKYVLKPQSNEALDKIVAMLKEHEEMEVTIEGHTDRNGSEASNLILSENRANAVRDYLVRSGIKRSRLSTVGYGEEKPIDPNDNEKAWALNRRVEFVLR